MNKAVRRVSVHKSPGCAIVAYEVELERPQYQTPACRGQMLASVTNQKRPEGARVISRGREPTESLVPRESQALEGRYSRTLSPFQGFALMCDAPSTGSRPWLLTLASPRQRQMQSFHIVPRYSNGLNAVAVGSGLNDCD